MAVLNPALNGQLRPKREDVRLSLNFRLDPTLTKAGRIFVSIKTLTDAATGAEVACTNCAEQLQVTFVESPPLRIQLILFGYNTNDPLKTHRPTGRDVFNFWSWLKRTFPVSDVLVEARMVEANFSPPFDVESLTCNIANAQLAAIRNLDIDGGTDQRFHYYGMVADSGGFMRGCANSIPNTPDHSAVASGPTGTGYAWDGDGSYGDWYGGHELAHTFGRLHPGFCDGNTRDDPDYPFERGQLSNADGVFVGFDVGGGEGIPMQALPGERWHDVMTYCAYQWISSYTFEGIRRRVVAEQALGSRPAPSGLGSRADSEALAAARAGG